jgi:tetratricopeptide (TPR) repeat protein
MALFRGEPAAALRFLDEASPIPADPEEMLEPDGPWPFREGWRRSFQRGTILLLLGDADAAASELDRAEALQPTAEGANNLGVAWQRMGRIEQARRCFARAIDRWPGYADASVNLDATAADRITTHPLRRDARRTDYAGVRTEETSRWMSC